MHVSDIPEWAELRSGTFAKFETIEANRAALVVVDMQNAFTKKDFRLMVSHVFEIIPNINRLIDAARDAGMKIVFLRHTYSDEPPYALKDWQRKMPGVSLSDDYLRPGQDAHEVHDDLKVAKDDLVLNKYRFSAMLPESSPLREILDAEEIDTLVITGTMTNCCCECTARDAAMMGYKVFAVSDAMAAVTDEEHNAALLNLTLTAADVRDTAGMVALIGDAR